MSYSIIEKGAQNSSDYRIYCKNLDGHLISPWHDIPMFADKKKRIYNMVVEIPRWTKVKFEIDAKETLNPMKRDAESKKRFEGSKFPQGYIWNYGAIPQTWEDPKHLDEATGCRGDNDPIDICEIGSRVARRGEVIKVKLLGVMALIDEGETDWKLIAIDVNDPVAGQLNDIGDVELLMPNLIKSTCEWIKIYNIPEGNANKYFAFDGKAQNRQFAENIIAEKHKLWMSLVKSSQYNVDGLNLRNTTLDNHYSIKDQSEIQSLIETDGEDNANVKKKKLDKKLETNARIYEVLNEDKVKKLSLDRKSKINFKDQMLIGKRRFSRISTRVGRKRWEIQKLKIN